MTADSTRPVELVDPTDGVARATTLIDRLGLEAGDRLALLLPNHVDTFCIQLATMLAGVVAVPLPMDLPPEDVAELARDAQPLHALVDPVATRAAAGLADQDVPIRWMSPGDLDALAATTPTPWPRTRPMAYTSGTTGRRKGVHVGVHDVDWGEAVLHDEHDAFERRHGERHLVVSPLYHSGPFRFAWVTALTGGHVAVLPRFDAHELLDTIRRLRPTSMFVVPTHLHRLLALDDLNADDLASFDLIAHAGAPCPRPLKERCHELAPDGSVWEFYGSTEGQFTVCPPAVWEAAPGSVGVARPGRDLQVRDHTGAAVTAGEVGMVWCRTPDHARWEYWRDADATAAAWDGDWFTVGDLGALDDGVLTLHGRPGDLVISGGVNVYPAEVERVLLAHPDVAEAVVLGVPDNDWGERVVAAVVGWPGRRPDTADLLAHARAHLARARVPKQLVVTDDLPRTPTGKVARVGLARALGFDHEAR